MLSGCAVPFMVTCTYPTNMVFFLTTHVLSKTIFFTDYVPLFLDNRKRCRLVHWNMLSSPHAVNKATESWLVYFQVTCWHMVQYKHIQWGANASRLTSKHITLIPLSHWLLSHLCVFCSSRSLLLWQYHGMIDYVEKEKKLFSLKHRFHVKLWTGVVEESNKLLNHKSESAYLSLCLSTKAVAMESTLGGTNSFLSW